MSYRPGPGIPKPATVKCGVPTRLTKPQKVMKSLTGMVPLPTHQQRFKQVLALINVEHAQRSAARKKECRELFGFGYGSVRLDPWTAQLAKALDVDFRSYSEEGDES